MQLPVYLDYAATTPVDPRVAQQMSDCLLRSGIFGNPASRSHRFGWQAEQAVENARRQVAELLNADPREIVWTSGATEADNLAIKGAAYFYRDRGRHIVTSKIEHKAVLDSCQVLEQQGFDVTRLQPDSDGIVHAQAVAEALRDDTVLVSLMHVNNEIGTLTDITAIAELTSEHNAIFHVDAAQSAGKIPIDLQASKVDLMSISAHKMYGPKGVGALFVRRSPRVGLEAQMHGGGHERGMRSGTLATHQIVGLGAACDIARQEMAANLEHIVALRQRLLNGLSRIDDIRLNGHPQQCFPGIINLSFGLLDGETLLLALKDLAVSSGSACSSASLEPSYVLRALGLSDQRAHSSLRISIGRDTTGEEIDFAVQQICGAVSKLRQHASP